MEQRNYFKKQINEQGRNLEKFHSDLLKLRNTEPFIDHTVDIEKMLKQSVSLSPEEIHQFSVPDFLTEIISATENHHENIEWLADILLLHADEVFMKESQKGSALSLYQKCLGIYRYLEMEEKDFSYGRFLKMQKIESLS